MAETQNTAITAPDGSTVRVRARGLDTADVPLGTLATTAALDQPDKASVQADPDNPGAFLVRRLPATDPAAGALTVVLTLTDPASGLSAQQPIEFIPGVAAKLTVEAEVVPAQIALPATPTPQPATPVATTLVTDAASASADPSAGGTPAAGAAQATG